MNDNEAALAELPKMRRLARTSINADLTRIEETIIEARERLVGRRQWKDADIDSLLKDAQRIQGLVENVIAAAEGYQATFQAAEYLKGNRAAPGSMVIPVNGPVPAVRWPGRVAVDAVTLGDFFADMPKEE